MTAAWGHLSRWWRLVLLCVGANLAETALVVWFDHGARPDLAPQASAVAPFGVFHDLRWISVYHDSWVVFAGEILGMLVVRGGLTALSVSLAWPGQIERPSARSLWWRGLWSSALAAVLLVPSVALLFGLATVPVSWLFVAAVPAALLVALAVHPAGISRDWWRRTAAIRAIGWIALAFLVLSVTTAVMAAVPAGLWPLVSALAGVFDAWCWVGIVHAVVDRRPARHVAPVLPVAILGLVGIVIGGTVLGFSHARPPKTVAGPLSPGASSSAPPVLVVSGYGSTWDGRTRHRVPGRFFEQQFSYRGLDPQGRPLPYGSAQTVKPLWALDRMLLAQVEALHEETGRRVDVIAESEGALVAKTALMAAKNPPVGVLVLASPLLAPGRVSYPAGTSSGWGVASAAAMRVLGAAFQSVSPIDLSPNSAFISSVDAAGPVLDKAMSCPVAGVRQFALLPLADATATPAGTQLSFSSVVVPAFHGGLLESASSERIVAEVLDDRPVSGDQLLVVADDAIRSAAGAWQVPPLVASDYPAVGPRAVSSAFAGSQEGAAPSCATVGRFLRSEVRPESRVP
ncbi:MAG TPA: hypothetical protein VMR97_03545 [Acidimicrobiales bacterium]|nr:hypothetical protein [Acidimicrobiales bacterium]